MEKSAKLRPNDYNWFSGSKLEACSVEHFVSECKFRSNNGNDLQVQRYGCMFPHSESRVDFYAASVHKDQLNPYWISEWTVPLKFPDRSTVKEQTSKAIKEMITIKSTFEHHLSKLTHAALITPIAFSYSLENEVITCRLLQQYSHCVRLCDLPQLLLQPSLPLYCVAQHLLGILEGLNYLHECSIVHGDLSTETILFDLTQRRVRLSFVLIQRLLIDFEERVRDTQKTNAPLEQIIGFQLNDLDTDYHRFALVLVWFMTEFKHNFDELISMKNNDLIQLLSNQAVDPCIVSLVKKCLNSTGLAQIEPLLVQFFDKFLHQTDHNQAQRKARHCTVEEESILEKGSASQQLAKLGLMKRNSRLADYEVICKLGHGGFGEVYKVRNILDQNEYALKKIIINTSNKQLNRKIKQEVRYLSGLNHENVVRYFGAWVEYEATDDNSDRDSDFEAELEGSHHKTHKPKVIEPSDPHLSIDLDDQNDKEDDEEDDDDDDELSEDEQRRLLFSSSFQVSKRSKQSNDELSDDYVNFCEESQVAGDVLSQSDDKSTSEGLNEPIFSISRRSRSGRQPRAKSAMNPLKEVMYIQMELCEKSTLQNAIMYEQLYTDLRRKRRLFRELIEGLAHIHEREIIHRDLKPGNIFLDASDHVKIGDFGLATSEIIRVEPAQTHLSTPQASQPLVQKHVDRLTVTPGNRSDERNRVSHQLHTPHHQLSRLQGTAGVTLTGLSTTKQQSEVVGTPFYLSPEILAKSSEPGSKKIVYSQKVDIYSVGVIYFEMCYPPPRTGMERFKVLTSLREESIQLPDDADSYLNEQEKSLINELLNHDPTKRPSSAELLQSSYLPPPEFEEEKQQNLIKHVIQNSRSKAHKFLLNELFGREMDLIEDFVYDCEQDVGKSKRTMHNEAVRSRVFQHVSDKLAHLMRRYGAVRYTVPTFVPSYSMQLFRRTHAFYVMDSNGSVVAPAYDLRTPFARHVSRPHTQQAVALRRYAIEKVYRSRVMGYHPRELWECAFDIVTSEPTASESEQGSILPDVEVLLLLNEILDQFACLRSRQFTLRVNSICFLRSVFAFFEVEPSKTEVLIYLIAESNERGFGARTASEVDAGRTPREHLMYMLSSKNLLDQSKLVSLMQILEAEKSTGKEMLELIQSLMRRRHQSRQSGAYEAAREALRELTLIVDCFQSTCPNLNFKIRFCPGLVLNTSNCLTYSKLVFQLDHETIRKRQTNKCILATGGRYDDLIAKFSVSDLTTKSSDTSQRALTHTEQRVAVGVSIEIEKIMRFVIEDDESADYEECNATELLLYAEVYDDERQTTVYKDLCKLAAELRQLNLRVHLFTDRMFRSLAELSRFCFESHFRFAFILSLTTDLSLRTAYRVRTQLYDRSRILERHSALLNRAELAEHIRSEVSICSSSFPGYSASSAFAVGSFSVLETSCTVTSASFTSSSYVSGSSYLSGFGATGAANATPSASSSAASAAISSAHLKYISVDVTASVASSTNVQLLQAEKTLSSVAKKKVLSMISSALSTKLNYLVSSAIEVLALEMPFKTLKVIALECDFERDEFDQLDDRILEDNVRRLNERIPKFRASVRDILERIFEFKRKKEPPAVVLTSLIDLHDFQFVIVT
jgi:translation initiation factor 2-alpha kinase 4